MSSNLRTTLRRRKGERGARDMTGAQSHDSLVLPPFSAGLSTTPTPTPLSHKGSDLCSRRFALSSGPRPSIPARHVSLTLWTALPLLSLRRTSANRLGPTPAMLGQPVLTPNPPPFLPRCSHADQLFLSPASLAGSLLPRHHLLRPREPHQSPALRLRARLRGQR